MGNSNVRQVPLYTYPSGNTYSGQMLGRKRHGQGTMTWRDGATYTGGWRSDKFEGYGTMRFPNGSVYEGGFAQNNPYGQGSLTTINQEVLRGEWICHGRSDMVAEAAAKYQFTGELIDIKSNTVRPIRGPLAFYLTSGLVSLPTMPDPMRAMLPYAEVVAVTAVSSENEKDGKIDKYDAPPVAVPVAAHAIQTAPSSSSSISYGNNEMALQERHPDDHARVDILDPVLHLHGLGIPVGVNPYNHNARRQQELQSQYTGYQGANNQL